MSSPRKATKATGALAADVACMLVFCAIGRRSHAEGVTAAGVLDTAWPFLTGTAAGWLVARAWRNPASWRTGLAVWVGAIVVGMLLRKATGAGTAVSFVVVASLVTATLLLGWRAAAAVLARRSAAAPSANPT